MNKNIPNFFILGAAKTGTTSIYHFLRQHPEIYLSGVKEPHFFDREHNYQKGIHWYIESLFDGANNYEVRGEATPNYFHAYDLVCPRLLEHLERDSLKFILAFRNPVDRAWSHYLHRKRIFEEEEPFDKALAIEEHRLAHNPYDWAGYFTDGLYAGQLKKWLIHFKKEQFHFLVTEEMEKNTHGALKSIFDFLGVDKNLSVKAYSRKNEASVIRFEFIYRLFQQSSLPHRIISSFLKRLLSSQQYMALAAFILELNLKPLKPLRQIDQKTAQRLILAYKDDIFQLEDIIEKDLDQWIRKYE